MNILDQLRTDIDTIDHDLLQLLARRMKITHEIAEHKKTNNIPVYQEDREKELMNNRIEQGRDLQLDPDFLQQLFQTILTYSRNHQNQA